MKTQAEILQFPKENRYVTKFHMRLLVTNEKIFGEGRRL
jgi:hypothetical protein